MADPVRRLLTAYGWFALVVSGLLYGGGALVFFFFVPGFLLHEHGIRLAFAIPAALAIGSLLTTLSVLGVHRGWITLGDD